MSVAYRQEEAPFTLLPSDRADLRGSYCQSEELPNDDSAEMSVGGGDDMCPAISIPGMTIPLPRGSLPLSVGGLLFPSRLSAT